MREVGVACFMMDNLQLLFGMFGRKTVSPGKTFSSAFGNNVRKLVKGKEILASNHYNKFSFKSPVNMISQAVYSRVVTLDKGLRRSQRITGDAERPLLFELFCSKTAPSAPAFLF
jgi:hypothetical protein